MTIIQKITFVTEHTGTFIFNLYQHSENFYSMKVEDSDFPDAINNMFNETSKAKTACSSFKNLVSEFSKIIKEYDSIIEMKNSEGAYLLSQKNQKNIVGDSVKVICAYSIP